MTTSPIASALQQLQSNAAQGGNAPPAPAASSGVEELANRDMFLKLLVAQMQNQNPLSPSDPIQFVSQLAQFSNLEQTMAMRGRLDDIYGVLNTPPATARQSA
jgi:flagellar hook assembly protein FlgD